jgi:hypothetical protein
MDELHAAQSFNAATKQTVREAQPAIKRTASELSMVARWPCRTAMLNVSYCERHRTRGSVAERNGIGERLSEIHLSAESFSIGTVDVDRGPASAAVRDEVLRAGKSPARRLEIRKSPAFRLLKSNIRRTVGRAVV